MIKMFVFGTTSAITTTFLGIIGNFTTFETVTTYVLLIFAADKLDRIMREERFN